MNALQRAVEWVAARALPVLSSLRYSNRGGWYPWVREPFTGAWQRNLEINRDSVLAHHAVFTCLTLISNDIAKCRPKLVEQDNDGIWTEVRGNSPFWPVLRKPNGYQTRVQFLQSYMLSKLIHGNSYVLKQREQGARGIVRRMYVLDPNRVRVLVAEDGEVFYELQADNLSGQSEQVTVPASEIIHDRWNCLFHPLVGLSPIFANGLSAHVGLTIQHNVSAFFANGSSPSGVLTAPGQIDEPTAERIKYRWETLFSGQNSGRVAVLGNDLKYQSLRMSAVDSQMLEFTKSSAEQVCSTFHVPQFKAGLGQMPTYQNGDTLNGIYYTDCLQSPIEELEVCWDEGLELDTVEGRTLGVELDLDVLLRMDEGAQIRNLKESVGGTMHTPNEARLRLNLKPKLGGDEPLAQQQMYSTGALARRDAQEGAPPSTPPDPPAPPVITPPNDAPDDAGERVLSFARRVNRRARTLRLRAA